MPLASVTIAAVWRQRSDRVSAEIMSAAYTWGGTLLAAILAWKELPSHWLAVAWAGYALVLLLAGRALKRGGLYSQAHGLAVCAILSTLASNFSLERLYHGVSLRLITVALVAAIFYACTRWSAE